MTRERMWTPHKCFAGKPMRKGEFREQQCQQCELVQHGDLLVCKHCHTGYTA